MYAVRPSAALLLAATAVAVLAQTEPTTTTLPSLPPEQETTVHGSLPDLQGRWLVLGSMEVPGGGVRTSVSLWTVETRDGTPVVTSRMAELPPPQQQAMNQANAGAKEWHPTPDDLAQIAAAWEQMPPLPAHAERIEHFLTGRDAFDGTFTSEPRVRDAQWVLQENYNFDASAAPALKQISVYAALANQGTGYTGNFTTTVLAAAPFPIPITLQGKCELFRLETPKRGVLGRLTDLFSGCGRSP